MTASTTPSAPLARRRLRGPALVVLIALVVVLAAVLFAPAAGAAPVDPTPPTAPTAPADPQDGDSSVSVEINGPNGEPSSSLVTLVGITLLSLAPTLLLMMTSFTKIFVVLALTRNALGTATVPPNMVLAGLALFLSMFVMWPVIGQINEIAVQPYLDGGMTFGAALDAGAAPLREFMLAHTREEDLALMTRAADLSNPANPDVVPLTTLVPAFLISELRAAFVIGFVVFVPFLVIDLVVSAALMSMGMMMLPPTMISLPFKLLLFVLVDGWGLITTTLISTYGVG
ncbi:flagellar type III secretion system pore protein FliP [Isoptericola sp. NEAU-Y5]|uniref:Flagellar biosynthetic protein FliP n=1 Tax=Isoptericola luteus TaxID=2879484 RepID=A0ABS7ZJB7_9MICO|nr:flagellar type III secretion system pore protein FliP [Isoptericola sp. NEAU-Y5]MCA5895120.1 flagellar type III secretion system pore protein FliP [Isoptericola sp. NEAU-Y5]